MGNYFLTKGPKTYNGERKASSSKWGWDNREATCRRIRPDCRPAPHTKINSAWIEDFSIKPETTEYLEESTGAKHMDVGPRGFCKLDPKGKGNKSKNE